MRPEISTTSPTFSDADLRLGDRRLQRDLAAGAREPAATTSAASIGCDGVVPVAIEPLLDRAGRRIEHARRGGGTPSSRTRPTRRSSPAAG